MKKLVFVALAIALIAVGRAGAQGGQDPANALPPAIITFAADVRTITMEAVESGAASIVLSWKAVGLTESYRMRLHTLQMGAWAPLSEQNLPIEGAARLIVSPTGDFTPPTYRLSILDVEGRILNQHIITIPFDTSVQPQVTIETFTATTAGVDFVELGQNRSRVPVAWRVRGRPATANLIFEQILPDGRIVTAELPRINRWIPSRGQGVVAPVLPSNEAVSVQLRLRVVDLNASGTEPTVLAEAFLTLSILRDGATAIPPLPTSVPIIPQISTPTPAVIASPTPSS